MNKSILTLLFVILNSKTFATEGEQTLKPDDQKPIYHDMICDVKIPEVDCYGNIVTGMTKRFVIPANLMGSEREVLLDQIAIEQKRAEEARQKLERQKQPLKELFDPDQKEGFFGVFEDATKNSQNELLNFLESTGCSFSDERKVESEILGLGQIENLSLLSKVIQTCSEGNELDKLKLDLLGGSEQTKLEISQLFENDTTQEVAGQSAE